MNDSKKLGLFTEYQQMPEYFDAHNINAQTEIMLKVLRMM